MKISTKESIAYNFHVKDCDERARLQRAREMEEGVEPPPGYRPNYPSGIQVHPNGITVDSLAALFQAHAGIQVAALTALSQIDFTLIPNIERPAHTQVNNNYFSADKTTIHSF